MGKHYFNTEQIQELRGNPYVSHVSEKAITYTTEFRELFARQSQEGRLPSQIFRACQLDPKILGERRISSFANRIRGAVKNGRENLEDQRQYSSGRPRLSKRTPEEEVRYLKHQLALKDQELSFLKKVDILDRKTRMKQRNAPPLSSSSSQTQ